MFNQTALSFMDRVANKLNKENKKPTTVNIEQAMNAIMKQDEQFYKLDVKKVSETVKTFL
tara:strand:+ start:346 stop:525 length:180 start_codon:yes stop_codon:yes gene_type:complete